MKTAPVLLGTLAAGALLALATRGRASTPPQQSGLVRQASVDGRLYTIFALGGGEYIVTSNQDPNIWIQFDGSGVLDKDDRSPDIFRTLQIDMMKFPPDLFSS